MHHLIRSNGLLRKCALGAIGASLLGAVATVDAAAPTSAPMVLLAITNSQSMDGTTAGAIMTGSGGLGSDYVLLGSSTSPAKYKLTDYPGFTPPLIATPDASGMVPWTVGCTSSGTVPASGVSPTYQCDNGPSRMNMTKAAIKTVLTTYGSSLNFGIYDYSMSGNKAQNTWVYLMSPTGVSFGFTGTSSTSPRTIANPCYGYVTGSSATATDTACQSVAGQYTAGVVQSSQYMTIGASSDDPLIVDVLYSNPGLTPVILNYNGPTWSNPYTHYSLATYNCCYNSSYTEGYSNSAPGGQAFSTTPTNAGYVPYSKQVFYSARGWGYLGSGESPTTGTTVVAMSTDPSSSLFSTALQPESNSLSTGEIKSFAPQGATYGLMNGAYTYLKGLTKATTCQTQFVILMTDGLPTMDSAGSAWPPLGTTTAINYGLSATYNADGSFASSGSQAVTDAITAITTLNSKGIKVFVIGLGAGVDASVNPEANKLLTAMAIAGGTGSFFPANSPVALTAAFVTVTDIIYKSTALAAPVAPISVAGGTSYEYELTSIVTPGSMSGHVQAFGVAASGVASSVASWDAGDATHMSTTLRGTALKSNSTAGAMVVLSSMDAAAFNLPATKTKCVPDTATVVSYTVDPSYSGGPSGCNYLGNRQSGAPLGVFSTQNTGRYMGPPQSALLTGTYPTYAAYARGLSTRKAALLFTDADGFLYSVDASTGLLNWGWTPRSILAMMQNYSTFQSSASTDGNFTVVDAMDSGNNWGTYVVGSFQSGAEHYSLQLDANGAANKVVYDTTVTGNSAGDLAGKTGVTPLRQPTVVAYLGNTAYHVYVVTSGSTSTLYEQDVTSGTANTPTALGFQVSSIISLDANSNLLWLGGHDGTVRYVRLSGKPSSDVGTLTTVGTVTVPPGGTTAVADVLYVGYVEVSGIPYVYAANSAQLTVFGITSAGWVQIWTTTTSQGYTWSASTSKYVASSAVTTLTGSSVVSDIPIQVGPGLLVPTFVASTATCPAGGGEGFYDFFTFADGSFPKTGLTYNTTLVTSDMDVGSGPAFTPSLTAIAGGIALSPGSLGNPNPPTSPLKNLGGLGPRAISWTQH